MRTSLGSRVAHEQRGGNIFGALQDIRGAGLGGAQVEGILGMSTGLREDFVPEDPRTILTTTPTTIASWAQEHFAKQQ